MRLLLDTNVWSHLVRTGAGEPFYRWAKCGTVDVSVAPATLVEVLRTRDAAFRRRTTQLVCRSRWTRLATEAESEMDELAGEIRRLHPAWLLDEPDQRRQTRLHHLWRSNWRNARRDDASSHRWALGQAAGARREGPDAQREQKRRWQEDGFLRSLEDVPRRLADAVVFPADEDWPIHEQRGWRVGTRVEPWRADTHGDLFDAVFHAPARALRTGEATTYLDWLLVHVNIARIRQNPTEFGALLLYQAKAAAMPRRWLRTAVALAQHGSKVNAGNPVDVQLSTYLYDADLFLTSDKRLARLLQMIRPLAPLPFAAVDYLDPAAGDLAASVDELTRLRRT